MGKEKQRELINDTIKSLFRLSKELELDTDKEDAITEITTIAEASEIWGKPSRTIKSAIDSGRFLPNETRQSGKTWLIKRSALVRLWGEPE